MGGFLRVRPAAPEKLRPAPVWLVLCRGPRSVGSQDLLLLQRGSHRAARECAVGAPHPAVQRVDPLQECGQSPVHVSGQQPSEQRASLLHGGRQRVCGPVPHPRLPPVVLHQRRLLRDHFPVHEWDHRAEQLDERDRPLPLLPERARPVRAEGPEATPRQAPGRPRLLQHAGGLRELWRRPQVARARLNDAPDRFGGRGGARGGEPGALRLGFLFLQVNLK
mmetsp:Transcript_39942/g.118490  ORF Transcript_39942/g.118490 Transcript_39942/m.118490 type:complete len:221 (-) Transcript_39942:487-1149(-)